VNVIIERATCVSCGSCWETCPGLFEQDPDDSFSRIIEKYRINGNSAEGTPPDALAACAQEASDLCPVQIISIIA
jgi:ferredoxin